MNNLVTTISIKIIDIYEMKKHFVAYILLILANESDRIYGGLQA